MTGERNSSATRVQPILGALIAADHTGKTWLSRLLAAASRSDRLGPGLLSDPGPIAPASVTALPKKRCRLACFEHSAPAPRAFLRWLIEHPDQLVWPTDRGTEKTFGDSTDGLRRRLVGADPSDRREAQVQALRELDAGVPSTGKWWAFEGATQVDCLIETEHLVLAIEGKRTDTVAARTEWYPQRNQLVRNLEAVHQFAAGRPSFVLLACERPEPELAASDVARSTPHLGADERDQLLGRSLGQATWLEICEGTGLDPSLIHGLAPAAPA